MRKCGFCGREVEDGVKFCPDCGTEIAQAQAEQSGDSAPQYEDPNGGQGDYSQPGDGQGNYGYGQPGSGQGSYGYGQPGSGQGSYGYGQPGNGQGYGYGQPGSGQGYGYGQPGDGQGNYGYGQPGSGQGYGYSQPGNGPGNYGYGPTGQEINSTPYLIFSILTTICCCLPFGIVSIVYAAKINSLQRMGDYEGARNAAKKAKTWMIVGVVLGLLSSIGFFALGVADEFGAYGSAETSLLADLEEKAAGNLAKDENKDKSVGGKKAPAPAASGKLGDSWKSYTVQINDTALTFPCEIRDVEALGFKMDKEDIDDDYVVNKNDYETAYFTYGKDYYASFMLGNHTQKPLSAKDCVIDGIRINDFDIEGSDLAIIFPGGIQIGTDIDVALEKWGEPTDSYEGEYMNTYSWYDEETWSYCEVSADPDTDKVIGLAMTISPA